MPFNLGLSDSLTLSASTQVTDYITWNNSDAPEGYRYGSYPDGALSRYTLEITQGESNTKAIVFDSDKIENVYVEMLESDWEDILINAADKAYHIASITYKNVTLEDVGFRTKGNLTLTSIINTGKYLR